MKKTRRQTFQALVGLVGLASSACQQAPSLAPVPVAKHSSHMAWSRAGFGPRPDHNQQFDWPSFRQEQLYPEQIDDKECEEKIRQFGFQTLGKTFQQLWNEHYLLQDQVNDENSDAGWAWLELPYKETVQATWLRAVYSRKQLQEVLVDFWHNHFNVYGLHDDVMPLMVSYDRDVIRQHVWGNFRDFLEAVTTHPAMLLYLNNSSNVVAGPNENFARELLELHTLGAENYFGNTDPHKVTKSSDGLAIGYTDNDVYEVARCFTGWTLNQSDSDDTTSGTGRFELRSEQHDRFNKIVLGRYLRADQGVGADGRAVLDLLATHPATARHVAQKLCCRLVSEDPPQELVDQVAQVFLNKANQSDQLRSVVATILDSPTFWASRGQKFKRPFEFVVGLIRGLNLEFKPDDQFLERFNLTGQPLFAHSQPDGYADKAHHWTHTSTLLFRWNLAQQLILEAGLQPSSELAWLDGHFQTLIGRGVRPSDGVATGDDPLQTLVQLALGPEFQSH